MLALFRTIVGLFTAALVMLTALGCVPSNNTYPSLSNQGVLGLSTNNPYLGTNLFLSREMEASNYLRNFIRGNGAPVAIEIIDPPMAATRVLMFYPSKKSVYAADLLVRDESRQWIVQGPFPIDRRDFRNLLQMELAMNGDPVFLINGKQVRYPGELSRQAFRRVLEPAVPTPKPAAKPAVKRPQPKAKPQKQLEVKAPPPTPTNTLEIDIPGLGKDFKPLNTDQQAYLMSKGYAERSSNGDIIHSVFSEKENLQDIAMWYTGSSDKAETIAKANGLKDGTTLVAGTRLRIPMDILKNLKAMPKP
jgi:hypothetical protein